MVPWNENANAIFLQAIELSDSADRERFILDACKGESALQLEVAALLTAYEESENFLAPSERSTQPIGNDSSLQMGKSRADTVAWDLPNLPTGTMIGRHRIERLLGRGGMGIVYLATDTRLNRLIALKIPRTDTHGEVERRIEREARTMASVKHRNLASIFDVDQWNGTHFLSMEYIDGECLSDWIARGERLEPRDTAELMKKLAYATAFAHEAGVIHRDIKPGNIMIDREGEPVLMDFGLAYSDSEDARLTKSGAILGTPAYMAPEQIQGASHRIGPLSDVYALGAISYELLTGNTVYPGTARDVLEALANGKEITLPSSFRPNVDPILEAICMRALQRRPEDRFPTARALGDACRAYLAGELANASAILPAIAAPSLAANPIKEPARHSPTLKTHNERSEGNRAALIGAALFGLILLAAVLIIQTSQGEFVISTDDPNIETRLSETGGLIVKNRETQKTYTLHQGPNRLPNGNYDLIVTTPDGLELSTPKFQLRRFGGPVIATVHLRPHNPGTLEREAPIPEIASSTDKGKSSSLETQLGRPSVEWSEPERVVFQGSDSRGSNASLSGNGLRMVFVRKLEGKQVLMEASRVDRAEPFQAPRPLSLACESGESIDDAWIGTPALSQDGLDLLLYVNLEDQTDLWLAHRDTLESPWQPLKRLGPGVNSSGLEYAPALSADKRSLYWFRPSHENVYDGDLWMATRKSESEPFELARRLGEGINTLESEQHPCLTADESTLIFDRGTPDPRLWEAHRDRPDREFGTASLVRLPESWRGRNAYAPSITSDGALLLFTSNVEAGSEGFETGELWQCYRLGSQKSKPLLDAETVLPEWLKELPDDLQSHPLLSPDWEWGPLENLGRKIFPDGPMHECFISEDELALVFRSEDDLWMTTRNRPSDPFGQPSIVIQDEYRFFSTLTKDRLQLWFCSAFDKGMGGFDLQKYSRKTLDAPFELAEFEHKGLNSGDNDGQPWLSKNGLELYFCSARPGSLGYDDLWVARRDDVSKEFQKPVRMSDTFNTRGQDFSPSLAADDRILLFASSRGMSSGEFDIFMSIRSSTDQSFSRAVNLGPHINSILSETRPILSADGTTLYFDSNRPGGNRQSDLWCVHRVRKSK